MQEEFLMHDICSLVSIGKKIGIFLDVNIRIKIGFI